MGRSLSFAASVEALRNSVFTAEPLKWALAECPKSHCIFIVVLVRIS